MVGIEGQWVLLLNVDDEKDVVLPWSLTKISIIEEAGLNIPTFYLEFYVNNQQLADKILNEGAKIELLLGRSTKDILYTARIMPLNVQLAPGNGNLEMYCVALRGILQTTNFMSSQMIKIYNGSSASVFSEVGSRSGFQPECDSTADNMKWIQYNLTDQQFLLEVWERAYLDSESVFIPAITLDNRLLFKNLTNIRKNASPKFKFAPGDISPENGGTGSGGEVIVANMSATSNSGLLNIWAGGGRKIPYNDLTMPIDKTVSAANITAILTDYVLQSPDMNYNREFELEYFDEDNVHPNFVKAKAQNLSGLALSSLLTVKFTVVGKFIKLNVLDIIELKVPSISHLQETRSAGEYLSGYYVVEKITYDIDKKFIMTVVCTREGINSSSNPKLRS